MSSLPDPARHARLFEFLRHQGIATRVAERLQAENRARVDGLEARTHLAMALKSWQRPEPGPQARALRVLAAKPGRDHEFFRAVRA
jgi:hypothetical protein